MRIGIIGSGFGLYGLFPAFNSVDGCKVVSVCGKKTDRLLSYCASVGPVSIYTDWQEMLKKEELDAVAIAVVPSAQFVIAKQALAQGLHVFAEKPLASSYEEASELCDLAFKYKRITAVDFIFPEIDEWQMVKQILEQKMYGNLKSISVAWDFLSYDIKNKIVSWKTNVKEGGGALSFYFSHVLYYLEYFGGKIKTIGGSLHYFPQESLGGGDVGVDVDMIFGNGVIGKAHLSCNSHDNHQHVVTFECDNGSLTLKSMKGVTENFTVTVSSHGKDQIIPIRKLGKRNIEEDERVRVVSKIAARFVKACNENTKMTPSFDDGLRVEELIDIVRSNASVYVA
ncbi:MAG TPA: Gfo/Idh/MocA family oxidoreductase [Candidatus Paceibacterota bacterium]|nr:Gfo/Idh/MocA family oxidoreductase [Candidatus Paceibacterota bacterium]HMO82758.1 Gfo/Idh/MocA family oxidoreductase [Candidatus Paceibacterota bacterium]